MPRTPQSHHCVGVTSRQIFEPTLPILRVSNQTWHSMRRLAIISEIGKRNLKQLLLTGHSLAGDTAHVAHLFIEGQLSQRRSTAWTGLKRKITCRTVAFSAPTMTINLNENQVGEARAFLQKVSEHSCNIIYNCNAVSYATGDIAYRGIVIEAVMKELVWKKVPLGRFGRWLSGVEEKVDDAFDRVVEMLQPTLPVMVAYHHLGNVIYYHNETSEPVLLRDSKGCLPDSVPELRANKDIAFPKENDRKVSVMQQLKDAHSFFPKALAYNVEK
jgi:hypothetical protein